MAGQTQLLNLQPFSAESINRVGNIPTNTSPHAPPDDILQLQADVINVLEGRVDITTFPIAYQKRIKSYYQFSATPYTTNSNVVAKRTRSTLDVI